MRYERYEIYIRIKYLGYNGEYKEVSLVAANATESGENESAVLQALKELFQSFRIKCMGLRAIDVTEIAQQLKNYESLLSKINQITGRTIGQICCSFCKEINAKMQFNILRPCEKRYGTELVTVI